MEQIRGPRVRSIWAEHQGDTPAVLYETKGKDTVSTCQTVKIRIDVIWESNGGLKLYAVSASCADSRTKCVSHPSCGPRALPQVGLYKRRRQTGPREITRGPLQWCGADSYWTPAFVLDRRRGMSVRLMIVCLGWSLGDKGCLGLVMGFFTSYKLSVILPSQPRGCKQE